MEQQYAYRMIALAAKWLQRIGHQSPIFSSGLMVERGVLSCHPPEALVFGCGNRRRATRNPDLLAAPLWQLGATGEFAIHPVD